MKTNMLLFICFIVLLSFSGSFSQDFFAPKMDIKKTGIEDPSISSLLMNLDKINIPDKADVGIPAYPQAKIIQIEDASKDCFCCIRLLTPDDCKKIVAFYRENLKNWFDGDFIDCHQFWQGARWEAMRGKGPNITILPAKDLYKKCFPEIKSEIQIWYASTK